jgi:anti-anti-sigma factor
MPEGLDVRTQWEQGDRRCLVALSGEARLETTPALDAVSVEIEARRPAGVLLDLQGLGFMDSASMGSILRLHTRVEGWGGTLVLFGLQRRVERLLDRLGLSQIRTAANEAAARAAVP